MMSTNKIEQNDFLNWILNPIDDSIFFKDFWEQKLLVINRSNDEYFKEVLTLEDIDELFGTIRIPIGNIDLAKSSKPLSKDLYCRNSIVDVNKVLKLHEDGATIILRGINNWNNSLQRLKQKFEAIFKYPAQVNIYLTPPQNQSTPPHWDTHDLFIFQIHGSKNWKIYETEFNLPLANERFLPGQTIYGDLRSQHLINSGDLMYLPRGVVHEPQSNTYSIHAAVGILPIRWLDVINMYIEKLSKKDSKLRQSVPISFNTADGITNLQPLINELMEIFPKFSEDLGKQTLEEIIDNFLLNRTTNLQGKLKAICNPILINTSSEVEHSVGLCYSLREENDSIELRWLTNRMSFPIVFKNAITFIAAKKQFKIHEIPEINEVQKIAIIESLVNDSFLRLRN